MIKEYTHQQLLDFAFSPDEKINFKILQIILRDILGKIGLRSSTVRIDLGENTTEEWIDGRQQSMEANSLDSYINENKGMSVENILEIQDGIDSSIVEIQKESNLDSVVDMKDGNMYTVHQENDLKVEVQYLGNYGNDKLDEKSSENIIGEKSADEFSNEQILQCSESAMLKTAEEHSKDYPHIIVKNINLNTTNKSSNERDYSEDLNIEYSKIMPVSISGETTGDEIEDNPKAKRSKNYVKLPKICNLYENKLAYKTPFPNNNVQDESEKLPPIDNKEYGCKNLGKCENKINIFNNYEMASKKEISIHTISDKTGRIKQFSDMSDVLNSNIRNNQAEKFKLDQVEREKPNGCHSCCNCEHDLEELKRNLENLNSALDKRIANIETVFIEFQASERNLQKEIEITKEKMNSFINKSRQNRPQIQQNLKKKMDEMNEALSKYENDLKTVKEGWDKNKKEVESRLKAFVFKKTINELKESISDLQSKFYNEERRINDINQQLEQLFRNKLDKTRFLTHRDALTKKLNQINKQIENVEQQLEGYSDDNLKLRNNRIRYESEFSD
ncbi:putative leucine-rich repeat-containing protein DDB_G0290503 [Centruroides vittatus]|uniref:putative leucine-rich repeat-containing protein DDB_G0290503 n=1 Tax=Centruroides vittatus TaxID=120091 RepID=UPI003510BE63